MDMGLKTLKVAAFGALLFGLVAGNNSHAGQTYKNPVYEEDFKVSFGGRSMTIGIGDPTVIFHNGKYYMYATGDNKSYNAYVSSDLVNWQKGPVVFEPSEGEGGLWAPDVFYNHGDKKFYLYYTAGRRIGVAVADSPVGKFEDKGTLVMGAIDAHMFRDDDGRLYLYYATYPSLNIYVQAMDSLSTKSKKAPVKLLAPREAWERKHILVTEAPWMLRHKGVYYLIYSGGGSYSMDYAIGYASSKSPTGPFQRYPGNPILKKGDGVFGPGHGSVVADSDGKIWIVYHQKQSAARDWMRFIAIDPIWFDEEGVLHGRATRSAAHPAPVVSGRDK